MVRQAAFVVSPDILDLVYGQEALAWVQERTGAIPLVLHPDQFPTGLEDVEVLFASWGAPTLSDDTIAAMPKLKLVLYGAGFPAFAPDTFWKHGIPLSTAKGANAIPVVEYAVSVIHLSLKQFWKMTAATRAGIWNKPKGLPGSYQTQVGLIGFGEIGRRIAEKLSHTDLKVVVHDPFLPDLESMPLEELFASSDVVSLHAPNVPINQGLVGEGLLRSMKPGATLINTSRGALIREDDLALVARERPDLSFVLDVTHPEPPAPSSPLWSLPNVVLTPHLAGSEGRECRRMGQMMLDELDRFLSGQPLQHLYPFERIGHIA